MRLLPFALFCGLAASTMSVPVAGQKADDDLAPASVTLLKQGEALLAEGKYDAADDALEAALVADPKNRGAFVVMAKVAMRQGLHGQAIRYSKQALQLEPTDREALLVQGQAMVELGATARARMVLEKLNKLCGKCAEASRLGSAIDKGPTLAAAKSPSETKNN